jgi:uncharacterized membrane protein YgcG
MTSLRSFIVLLALLFAAPVHAEMQLPQPARPVVDLTDTLTAKDEQQLTKTITKLEKDLHWKVRVLTINLKYRSGTDPYTLKDQTPGRTVKPYWGLDDRSILVVMNTREDNPLNLMSGMTTGRHFPEFSGVNCKRVMGTSSMWLNMVALRLW